MKFFSLVLLLGLSVNQAHATPPPQDGHGLPPGLGVFVPHGGGIKGTARMFPLTIDPQPCDRGYRVQLIKMPGIAQLYRTIVKEIRRDGCTEPFTPEQSDSVRTKLWKLDDGTRMYEAEQGSLKLKLSDKTGMQKDPLPTWVAEIDGELYFALTVDRSETPAE